MARKHYLPDGKAVLVPDNMSYEDADAWAMRQVPESFGIQQQHGFVPALKSATKAGTGATLQGLGSLSGWQGLQQYGTEMMAPDTAPGAYHPYTAEEIAKKDKEGLFAGLGARGSKYITEPIGEIAGRYGVPTLVGAGAAALAPEAGALGLGLAGTRAALQGAGFMAADFPASLGENIQRQEEVRHGAPVNQEAAITAALAQSALIPVLGHLGGRATQYFKLMGPDLAATARAVSSGQMTQEAAIASLNSTAKNLLVKTGEAAAVGAPMMVGTEALRTAQSGEDVTGEPAMGRYGEALKAAAAFAPLGGVLGGLGRRGQVRQVEQAGEGYRTRVAEQEAAAQREADMQRALQGETDVTGELGLEAPAQPTGKDVYRGAEAPQPEDVLNRGFFNALGVPNNKTGRLLREYEGTALTDPKIEGLRAKLQEIATPDTAPKWMTDEKAAKIQAVLDSPVLKRHIQEAKPEQADLFAPPRGEMLDMFGGETRAPVPEAKPMEQPAVDPYAAKRAQFDAAQRIWQETGNDAPLRAILEQAKQEPGYMAPLLPEERAAFAEKPAEPAPVEPRAVEAPVEAAPEAPAPAPKKKALKAKKQIAPEVTEQTAATAWEEARDNSASFPAYAELHPDAQAALRAKMELNNGELSGKDFKAVSRAHNDALRSERIAREVKDELGDASMRPGEEAPVEAQNRSAAEAMVNNITSKWSNAPKVEVKNTADLDPAWRAWVEKNNPKGFIKNDGSITILADRNAGLPDVKATLFHEALGHYGLRAKFRSQLNTLLGDIYKTNAEVRKLADAERKNNPKLTPEQAVEEVLAERQIAGGPVQNALNRVVAKVREFLRKMGLAETYTDNDIIHILRQARDAVTQGPRTETPKLETAMARDKEAAAAPAPESPRAEPPEPVVTNMMKDYAGRFLGPQGEMAVTDVSKAARKAVGYLTYLHDLVSKVEPQVPSARKLYDALQEKHATRFKLERLAESVAENASYLSSSSRDKLNRVGEALTLGGKWGYQPTWMEKRVTIDPESARLWSSLDPKEQAVLDAMFKHGYEVSDFARGIYRDLGVEDMFAKFGQLEGPYLPLRRYGNWVTTLKSKALLDAEKRFEQDPSKANAEARDLLKADKKNFVTQWFDTAGQAEQFMKREQGKYAFADFSELRERTDTNQTMPSKVLDRILAAVKTDNTMPKEAQQAMADTIKSLYLSALTQHEARQAGARRLGVAGAHPDMIRSFLSDARSRAAYLSNLKHGPAVNESFVRLQKEAKSPTTGKRVNQEDVNLLTQHYAEGLQFKDTPLQDWVVGTTSAWQLLTSLGYHVANFTQGAMVTVPKLAADFNNYSGAWKHLMDGYGVMSGITKGLRTDLTQIKNKELRTAIQRAADDGLIDIGFEQDIGHFDRFKTGYKSIDGTSAVAARALYKLRQVARAVETWNRVASGSAAYNMARQKGYTPEKATNYMLDVLRTTQGDMSHAAAPLLIKKLPKVMTQYRKYQLLMMAFYAKAYNAAFHGASAEERAVGKRMLGFKLFHTSMAAGALGLPLMNLASFVFGLDDSGQDMETVSKEKLKELFGEDMGKMLAHGPLSLAGLDMSARLGDNNAFAIAPYTKFDLTSAGGAAQTAAGLVGGPALGQLGRMASGIGLMQQGDIYKGVEKMVPKGLEAGMQAFRMANEGVTLRNGDVLVKPEDLSAYALALQAVGMPPTQIREIMQNQNTQYQIKKYYTEKTKSLEHRYAKAVKEKDQEEMASIRQEWMDMQKSKDEVRKHFNGSPDELKKQPISNLLNYPRVQQQRMQRIQRSQPDI